MESDSFSLVSGSGFQQRWVLINPCLMSGAWKAPPGSCWLFLAPTGSSWAPPGSSSLLLVLPGSSWKAPPGLLAPPGNPCNSTKKIAIQIRMATPQVPGQGGSQEWPGPDPSPPNPSKTKEDSSFKTAQEVPGGARRSQGEPGRAKRSQEEPGGAQEEPGRSPGGARGSQEGPGRAKRSQEEPGGAQEEPEGQKTYGELLAPPCSSLLR